MADTGKIVSLIKSIFGKELADVKTDITEITEQILSHKNIFDDTELKAGTGITFDNGEYIGTADALYNVGEMMSGEFDEGQQYVFSVYAQNIGAKVTDNGICLRIVYSDDSYSSKYIPNSTTTLTRFNVVSNASKNVKSVCFVYETGINNTWRLQKIQIEKGSSVTDYVSPNAIILSAVDQLARNVITNVENVLTTNGETSTETEINITGTYISGKRILLNVGVGNTVDMTPGNLQSYGYIVSDCKDGDYFTIKGTGGDGPRLWGFVNAANKLLSVADAYAQLNHENVNVPTGATKAVFNSQIDAALKIVRHTVTEETEMEFVNVKAIDDSFSDSQNLFDKSTIIIGKKYADGAIVDDSSFCLSDFIEIEPNKTYTYRGVNGAINYFNGKKVYLSAESITTYDSAITKTSVTNAKYVRLQMGKLYYPYHALVMNRGSEGSKEIVYGKLLKEEKKSFKPYAFSDIPIPTTYTAYGVKAVDGSTGTDFDNEHPSLTDVYDAFDALVTAYPDYVTKDDLGTDQSGTYHIYAYYFTPEAMTASSTYYRLPYPKINILAGIHGSYENSENIFSLYYLMKSLCDSWNESDALEYLRWNVRFAVVPVQNPYGYVNSTRGNSRGIDLNRNFSIGWHLREQSSAEYGGTEPMSEAETIAIANFVEANKDAIFSIDLHGTGQSSLGQDSLIYCGTDPTDEMFYVIKSLMNKMSHYWDSQNIPGLNAMNYHGFITGSIEGDGTLRAYMFAEKKMHSMVLEAFTNFTGSSYTKNSEEIMQMNADKLGYCLLYGLNHFRNNS